MEVFLLALGAAALFGIGSVVQQRVASTSPPGKSLRPSLLLWLARQPLWLVGVATAVVGNLLSGAALGLGSVALVQPLLVSRLLVAIPLSAAWMRRRLGLREWGGVVATTAGLAAFIAIGRPEESDEADPSLWRWGITVAAIAVVALLLVRTARQLVPHREAPMLGAGAGMLFALQSALTHTAVGGLFDNGLVALLTSWVTYAVAVAAVAGTLLAQSAYEMAPLQASYPTLAAVEPLAGVALAIGLLGGSLTFTPWAVAGEVAGLAVMTAGIYLLASSPLVTAHAEVDRQRQAEDRAYRTEEELEEDLARLSHDLELLSASTARRRGAQRTRAHLERALAEVRDGLRRLAELRADIERHQAAERERAAAMPPHQRAELERHESVLDARKREIDERAEALHERATELVERVLAAGGSTTGSQSGSHRIERP